MGAESTTHNSAQKNCCLLSSSLKPFTFLQPDHHLMGTGIR
ncbi:hypothetical protein PanWU01x14_337240 [Parasponia andersonii]|uniref:Uncharacterized protein n=1 Tax=Parasponia andersonii TaxID=3476 RepID=A0A2P5AFM0_PARAD|nr:hypothetical protein PanWU01x14_337240 [Parasponia andersonii]